jgi:hypothetical protein
MCSERHGQGVRDVSPRRVERLGSGISLSAQEDNFDRH